MKCKIFRTYRRKFAIVLAVVLLHGMYLTAQTQKVTLKQKNVPVSEVFEVIKKQTNLSVIYNVADVNPNKRVNVNVTNQNVEDVIKSILTDVGKDLTYVFKENYIVLSKKSDNPKKANPLRTITGKIVDENGEPAIGASIVVKGDKTKGAISDMNGAFTIENVPENAILDISYIGMQPQSIPINGETTFNIVLEENTEVLSDLVVTALGIKRSEKALSYNVTELKSEDVLTVKDANFINALSGKVAGLNINSSSSGIGGASKVVMRGAKSINESSNALYVVDGIPMFSRTDGGSKEFESQGATEGIADINPEDIESMSVLSGAAAAALYGSDAANGAIVITTKSGQAGKTSLTVSSNTEFLEPFILPQFQDRYGTSDTYRSWGPLLNESNFMGYNPRKDYFNRGIVTTESVSLSTGTAKNQTYASASAVNSKGVIPNNKYNRYNVTLRNTTSLLDEKMKLDFGISYIHQNDNNMTNQGVYMNPIASAYLFPRGNDWNDIKMYERYNTSRKISEQYWPSGAGTYVLQNPYWINYRNLRENKKDRYMINLGLTYDILDWLNISTRVRSDNSTNDYTDKRYASTNTLLTGGSPNGFFEFARIVDKQFYGDFLINVNKNLTEDLNLQFHGGSSYSELRYDAFSNKGPIAYGLEIAPGVNEFIGIPNVFHINQLSDTKTIRTPEGWAEATFSVFASAELGYKNTYYLTITGRADKHSKLAGARAKSPWFKYPSIGSSILLSEIFDMPDAFPYLKVRGSWALAGLPIPRGIAVPYRKWNPEKKAYEQETIYPVENLKAEQTSSWEFGIDTRFLDGFSANLTLYSALTDNQTFDPKLSASSGYSGWYLQTGSVLNRGLELGLGYEKTWNKFTWSSNYTLGMNRNEILDLADNAVNPFTGEVFSLELLDVGGLGQTRFILKKGGGLGDLYSTSDLVRDDNGAIYVDEKGGIQVQKIDDAANYIKLGSVFSKANMSWRNDFTYGDFKLGFMFSARLGGIVFSRTQAAMDYYGVSEATAVARDNGGVIINNGDLISAKNWYSTIANGDGLPQYYIYDATNVRLQEASIGYRIPKKIFGDIMDATISVVGRNLLMVYSMAPFDPESVASTGNYYQGIDYFMTPNTRNIGLNLRLRF